MPRPGSGAGTGPSSGQQLGRDAEQTGRQVAASRPLELLARLGLAARGLVYVLIGLLAVQVAVGRGGAETDQNGALRTVAGQPFGEVVLWVLAVGFAGYALWRLTEVAFGEVGGDGGAGGRVRSLLRALAYGSLCFTTMSLLTGTGNPRGGSAGQSSALSARVMSHSWGRLAVGAVGLALVAAGIAMIVEGVQKKFMKFLRTAEMDGRLRDTVEKLGRVGTIARGAVFALAGVLVVVAAVTFDPSKARGLDGALKTLARSPGGPVLLGAVALGLVAFGVFGLVESRYRRTTKQGR